MDKDVINYEDTITRAIDALISSTDESELASNEKMALKILLDKLLAYYNQKVIMLSKYKNDDKIMELRTFMTDIIVEINNILKQKVDVFYFINTINKKIK